MSEKIVAVDVGFGFVKAMDSEGHSMKFISEFALYDRSVKAMQGIKDMVELDGSKYIVGNEIAKRELDGERINTMDRLIYYSPLFVEAVSDKMPVNGCLAVGLPLTEIKRAGELKRRLKDFYPNTEIVVCAQGLGVFFDTQISDVIVLDIGYNTLDIYVAADGKVIPDECISIEGKGMIYVVNNIWMHIIENHKMDDVTVGQVEEAIRGNNRIKKHGKPIDIQKDIDNRLESWQRMLLSTIKNGKWARRLDKVEKIVIAGGGAHYFALADVGKDNLADRILKPDKPEFANVRGFLKKAQSIMDKRR